MVTKNYIQAIFISLFLSSLIACGGDSGDSGDSNSPPKATTKSYSVTVIDGYLQSATVWLDINNNGIQDTGEPTTVTETNGKGNLTLPSDVDPTKYSTLAHAEAGKTFDESLNRFVEKDFILASPKGEQIISPLTTLIYLKGREGFDKDEATSLIRVKFNFSRFIRRFYLNR